jgi:uncharacterized protein
MFMRIGLSDLSALSLGAAVLGTGGGGDPYIGRLALKRQIECTGIEPEIIALDTLSDEALVIPVGMGGSPSVALEKLMTASFAEAPLRRVERLLGRRADAVIPLEIGGINSLMPLLTACATGVPVVNADGMGRAFPTLDKTTFGIAGISACPVIVLNEHGETVVIEGVRTHARTESLARAAIVEMGGACACALYCMTGLQAKETAIADTITLALEIGRAIEHARVSKNDPCQAILARLDGLIPGRHARVLFDGKVVDIERNMVGGYNQGSGVLEGIDDFVKTASFAFQNEYLYVRQGERLLAIVPDLIAFLDRETADPITCETVRYGQRVRVIGIASAAQLRTADALSVCGPRGFGLTDAYTPIESLAQET